MHSTVDVGNDTTRYSVGTNLFGWFGREIGVSDELNVFSSLQFTPLLHAETSFGLDGIGVVIGLDINEMEYDIEIKIGWGSIALVAAYLLFPIENLAGDLGLDPT